LKGEEIPLSGRICAVADVFDALTTPRPYKAEVSLADALRLIADSGGQLFDPMLVEIFADNFTDILKHANSPFPRSHYEPQRLDTSLERKRTGINRVCFCGPGSCW